MSSRIFRTEGGALPNSLAIGYALSGYTGGLLLMAMAGWLGAILGTLWFAHSLVISAYLFHEFAHNTVFSSPAANRRWGTLMIWLTGACYARYEYLRHKHMRHHVDRADVISMDIKAWLNSSPAWLRKTVLALEWAYIPAVDLIMHGHVILMPFREPASTGDRLRMLAILALRGTAFTLLSLYSAKALFLYALAYLLMISVLHFTDAFQHTYDAFAIPDGSPLPTGKVRDRAYEQANTYSNLLSKDWPRLNLLLLNFPYHNAHHERPTTPWHRLPALHRELYGAGHSQVLPMASLLNPFHRHRVSRVLSNDYGEVDPSRGETASFKGAVAVSFLTAV